MQSVKEIVRELKVFERNKIPLEIKVLGIATYIQTSSVRRTAKILSEIHPVSNLCLEPDKEVLATDETVVVSQIAFTPSHPTTSSQTT